MPARADFDDPKAYNEATIAEFRANGGHVTGDFAGRNILLLTTTGARTGRSHVTPLGFTPHGDRILVSAADGGADHHPAWYHNLRANPEVTLEILDETIAATAVVTEGEEYERLAEERLRTVPAFARNQGRTTRRIPLVWLDRHA